ncbi:MAG: class I tRNA ligase family protein, partial [Propionibacteriaceae bacterium]|nr:class I tRNA ligase family protein [Propionibacteriaceae bacterium]
SRFFTKVLHDLGLIDFDEPFKALMNQGQVINQGKAMSKSLGNGVDLGAQLDRFGVDAIRTTMVFAGPPEDDIDWADVSPLATLKFLQRAWRIAADVSSQPGVDPADGNTDLRRVTHRILGEVTDLLEAKRFNVCVARLMELVNATRKVIDSPVGGGDPAVREAAEYCAVALSLFAPYVAEEMWERLGQAPSVAQTTWPKVDPQLRRAQTVTMVVQVQGKVRAKLAVNPDITEDEAKQLALTDAGVQRVLDGRAVERVILRLPQMVSIVPA